MLISNLFRRHKTPAPKFAPGLFLILFILFIIIGEVRPILALTGLGTISIIAAVLVELNRDRTWDTYVKSYRRQKSFLGQPNHLYYTINVYVLWPLIFLLGAACLWLAYQLG